MKPINFRRIFLWVSFISFILFYSLLWLRMINDRAQRTGTDFVGFYTAAQIARTDGPQNIYIPELQQQIEEKLVGFDLAAGQILLFNHLPYLVPLLDLIVTDNYVASFVRWLAILLVFFLLDTYILISVVRNTGLNRKEYIVLATGTMLFFPVFMSLMNGQDTAFLFLGAALLLWGFLNEKPASAGIGLSMMTIRPQLALILAIPFLFQKRKIWWWFLLGSVSLGIFTLAFLGMEGTQHLIRILLTSSQGDWYGLHPEEMPTLTGLLHRSIPALSSRVIQVIGMAGYLISMAGLCLTWRKSKQITPSQIGLAFLISIFFVPYLHYHDLTLLLIPLFCLLRLLLPERKEDLVLLPFGLSFFLLLGFFWDPIRYLTVTVSMLFLAFLLLHPDRLKFIRAK
jgi:hypothetical protein